MDIECPIIETSVSEWYYEENISTGNVNLSWDTDSRKGSNSSYRKRSNNDGVGEGGESVMITYTGETVERLGSPGGVNRRGYAFSRTSSGGKLAFLNSMVGVFENEIDDDGNFSEKAWEWI